MFHLLLEGVLRKFNYYLTIYTFSTLQQQFESQKACVHVLMAGLYVFLSA
jgi:hypothetical protein